MLSHSSGLSDADLSPIFDDPALKKPGKIVANDDLIPLLARSKITLKLKPGEKWWYSNIAYQLLALLVERQSGEKFSAYLSNHIFQFILRLTRPLQKVSFCNESICVFPKGPHRPWGDNS